MRNVLAAIAIGVLLAGVGAGGQASAAADDDSYKVADAGSFGVVAQDPASVYCAADAGSLGHPNPSQAC
jgi:hypothetical protein